MKLATIKMSLLNCMPHMPTCQNALCTYMLTCHHALYVYILVCLISMVNIRVKLDKNLDKDVFHTIKTVISYPPKSTWNKIIYVNFWKISTNYEKIDNFRHAVPTFDIKFK